MTAYYNEHDPFAAAWLGELIADNLIAPGEVDERSIEDVTPDDLRPFRQCHFFAGIGVWSLAARQAGWPDDAPLWSGSCPCQPFSAAGKGGGFDDERHLWPAFHYLIEQCGPAVIVGEQVAGADGDAWFDLVSADLDATGYAFGAAETCAAGFGAPHERSRNYWLAHRLGARLEGLGGDGDDRHQPGWIGALAPRPASTGGELGGMALSSDGIRWAERGGMAGGQVSGGREAEGGGVREGMWVSGDDGSATGGDIRRMANPNGEQRSDALPGARLIADARRWFQDSGPVTGLRRVVRPGPTNGFWRDADWLRCRDEKWRPVESSPLSMADAGTIRRVLAGGGGEGEAFHFPLAEAGTFRNRVGLLRGAGNAITIGQAVGFLRAVMGAIG